MKKLKEKKYILVLIPLAAFVLFSYGLLLNKLGFYWDDWPYEWTRLAVGYEGLLRHFSFSRPVAGQLHNIAILINNGSPLIAQIYGLVMQVFGGFCLGLLIHETWRGKTFAAVVGALLFTAYPGFTMRPIAVNFSFSFFLMGMLSLSFVLSIRAARSPKRRVLRIILAALIALMNLFASEYFFLLELLRPFFIAAALADEDTPRKDLVRASLRSVIPFAGVFLCGVAYRMFFNKTQTLHYEFKLLTDFKASPLSTVLEYIGGMFKDSFRVVFEGWGTVFEFPNKEAFGARSTLVFFLICAAVCVVSGVFLFLFRKARDGKTRQDLEMIGIGVLAILLAGQPFWLTESPINFIFQNGRYTLPFMPGISLFLAGILDLITRPRIVPVVLAAVFIGLAAGHLFYTGNEYRRDWTLTKDFFNQLKWRVPDIEENTVVVTNVLPIRFSTDNSLTAPLNWIYADSYENDRIPYMLYTDTKRENTLSGLTAGNEVFQEYLTGQFYGNTDDMIAVYYNAPGCVHVLDPEVDVYNRMIPEIDRTSAELNNYDRIITDAEYEPLPEKQFGAEPAHGWCYYYETADLARQKEDWESVAELGDTAFALDDHPNDPMERIPFIEGYAHAGRLEDAIAQTEAAMETTPVMNDPLCALWRRIDRETGGNTLETELSGLLDCSALGGTANE